MKIFAVGMNYAEHNKELADTLYNKEQKAPDMGHDREPVIFTKADSALLKDHKPFFVPDDMGQIDYEAELVVRICRLGKSVPQRFAHRYYDAVTVGIDFTARDMQRKASQQGLPWTICKGFDGSAVIGDWVPKELLPEVQQLRFRLDKNGKTVQEGWAGDMVFGVDELVAYVSRFFTLKTGDLLFTGTPAGVGPVAIDDHLEGWVEEKKVLDFNCK
jgi:2-keto-4-pentenoate hydratase/2-oxohepta-3-ene-1,7-dioic acid hydratase in catechol pathway